MKRLLLVVALLLVSLPLAAQMHPGRQPGMGMTNDMSMMGGITVGPDGTIYTLRVSSRSDSTPYELVAIRPSGTVAWTAPIEGRGSMSIAAGSSTVFVASFGTTGTFPNLTVKSQLLGFTTSGAKVFGNDLDGIAIDLTPFAGGVYVLEISGSASGMMNSIGRKLLSVGNSGTVNWTLPLD